VANDGGNSFPNLEAILSSLCPGSIVSVADLSRAGIGRNSLSVAIIQAYTEVRSLTFLSSYVHVEVDNRTTNGSWTHVAPILVLAPPRGAIELCKRYEKVTFEHVSAKTKLLSLGHDRNLEWEELKVQWQAVQPSEFIVLRSYP
jgi:hypothetical protein